ncbi:MAG: M48 family metallopeptidase [Acidobacteriota bacterium]|jgi:predicted Zn-dependent protease
MQSSRKVLSTGLGILLILTMSVASYASDRRHGDVENIGNRDITGHIWGIFPNFVSLEKEIQLGQQVANEFEQTAKMVDDPVITAYVDRVAQNIVKHSDAKVPFHVKVVDTDEVNAFAFPGGFFYVNKGLILAADNESELAGVMAHEISHVAARHATARMTKGQILQLAAIPALFVGGYWAQMAIQNGLGLGINLSLLGVTRESEKEADQLGIQYLWNTGYDPNGFVSFFEKLQEEEKAKPGKVAGFFRTHPFTVDRIASAMDEERYLPEHDNYVVDTSEFDRVKARLLAIDNAMKADEASPVDQKKPTLKRRTDTGDDPNSTDPQDQKKKPTLKKAGDPGKDPDKN